jgi:hypothetical protein
MFNLALSIFNMSYRLKEERDRQDRQKASPGGYGRRDSKEGAGNMIALTAHAHSSYGRESYTPLGPGTNPSSNYTSHNTGNYTSTAFSSGLASPAMRYVSPLKRDSIPVPAPSVHTTPIMAHAPFVVRHASSDFISGVVESRVAGSPSISYPLTSVNRSNEDPRLTGGMSGGTHMIMFFIYHSSIIL